MSREGLTVHTHTGREVYLLEPTPDMISFTDIAYSLDKIPRFNGHTHVRWSVLDHSVLVSRIACEDLDVQFIEHQDPKTLVQLVGLLHDAHEAYIGDITTPVANAIIHRSGTIGIHKLKADFDAAISAKAGILGEPCLSRVNEIVKNADRKAMELERRFLFSKLVMGIPIEWMTRTHTWQDFTTEVLACIRMVGGVK